MFKKRLNKWSVLSRRARKIISLKGGIIFYGEGKGRLSVIGGRQFFLVTPLEGAKKFWPPLYPSEKKFCPLFGVKDPNLPLLI